MKFADHLSKEQKKKLNKLRPKELNERDLRELMGSNNRGMKRKKGGAKVNA